MAIRARFSLLSLMLLVGLMCGAVAYYRVTRENQLLLQENRKLKELGGFIDVSDPEKAYVRQIESAGPQTWRFQVYLPEEREYRISWAPIWMPDGFPDRVGGKSVAGGGEQFTLTVSLFKVDTQSPAEGYGVSIRHRGGSGTQYFYVGRRDGVAASLEWLTDQRAMDALVSGQVQLEFGQDENIDVMRHQAYAVKREQMGAKSRHLIEPGPGFMLWLEPQLRDDDEQ